jgi:hypothetical protein
MDGSEPSRTTHDPTAEILLQMWCRGGGAKILRLGLLKKEIPLNRIVGSTNQNVWVPLDLGPTRICHESTWVPPKHIVGPV